MKFTVPTSGIYNVSFYLKAECTDDTWVKQSRDLSLSQGDEINLENILPPGYEEMNSMVNLLRRITSQKELNVTMNIASVSLTESTNTDLKWNRK